MAFIAQPVRVAKFNEPDHVARFCYFTYKKNCWFCLQQPHSLITMLFLQYHSGNGHFQMKFALRAHKPGFVLF